MIVRWSSTELVPRLDESGAEEEVKVNYLTISQSVNEYLG
jgi:hypothetical protein